MDDPFALQTADARFDPREPVRVNGFLYVPADARQPPKVAKPDFATPAAVRWLSCEPLLGPVDLGQLLPDLPDNAWLTWLDYLDWIIVGGESGPGARPMHPDWARYLRDQCAAAGVSFFFKQWGEFAPGEIAGDYLDPEKAAKGLRLFDGRWDECWSEVDGHCDDEPDVYRIGKKRAGRLLDGREWNEVPV